MEQKKLKQTRRVAILNKKQHTPTLASSFVKDLDSNDKFSIKFQGTTDVNFLISKVEKGNALIVEGYMGENKFGPELTVFSYNFIGKKESN